MTGSRPAIGRGDSGADDESLILAVVVRLVDRARPVIAMPIYAVSERTKFKLAITQSLQDLNRLNFPNFLQDS